MVSLSNHSRISLRFVIMKNMNVKNVQLIFRLGLAFVFIYAGIGSLTNPEGWVGFVPGFVSSLISAETFLVIHGIFELVLAVAILFNLWPKIVYAFAALSLLGILFFYGVDEVTFRDVGLFALSVGLWVQAMRAPSTQTS